mmetsp:Transcript_8252/g.20290  ORF Transcript_8252/g.20290 Transcript_8252/m.20290 type:complete len:272 (-) Transcript_8252:775-1590(-)
MRQWHQGRGQHLLHRCTYSHICGSIQSHRRPVGIIICSNRFCRAILHHYNCRIIVLFPIDGRCCFHRRKRMQRHVFFLHPLLPAQFHHILDIVRCRRDFGSGGYPFFLFLSILQQLALLFLLATVVNLQNSSDPSQIVPARPRPCLDENDRSNVEGGPHFLLGILSHWWRRQTAPFRNSAPCSTERGGGRRRLGGGGDAGPGAPSPLTCRHPGRQRLPLPGQCFRFSASIFVVGIRKGIFRRLLRHPIGDEQVEKRNMRRSWRRKRRKMGR